MGIVIDKELAKASPCKCYAIPSKHGDIDSEELLCFSQGIIGALTDEQEQEYCTEKKIIRDGGELRAYIQYFSSVIDECKGRTFDNFIKCVKEKLEKWE